MSIAPPPLTLREENILIALQELTMMTPRERFTVDQVADHLHAVTDISVPIDDVRDGLRTLAEARLATASGYGMLWRAAG